MSYCQTSSKNYYTSKNIHKQLKCAGVQQLKRISQQKEQIFHEDSRDSKELSFHEDSMMDTIYKEDSKLENSQCTMEDNILENSSMLNIFEKSYTPENKVFYFKI